MIFDITILGSSSAFPTKKRFPSAQLLHMHGRLFLIDCGEGAQIQLIKAGVGLPKIDKIFISHLHGDHFYGLPGLISSMHLSGREKPLLIYSDPALKEILSPMVDIHHKDLRFEIVFKPLLPGENQVIYEEDSFTVQSFPLDHGLNSWGFMFSEKERPRNIRKDFVEKYNPDIPAIKSIKRGHNYIDAEGNEIKNSAITKDPVPARAYSYCSDTRYFEKLPDYIAGTTTLYHEASYLETDRDLADSRSHSTAYDAAKVAKTAQCKKLILGHFSARYRKMEAFLEEAQMLFPNTYLAEDLMSLEVE